MTKAIPAFLQYIFYYTINKIIYMDHVLYLSTFCYPLLKFKNPFTPNSICPTFVRRYGSLNSFDVFRESHASTGAPGYEGVERIETGINTFFS